jgi:predicted PhzF superfamily epimerase YddE/YHI9
MIKQFIADAFTDKIFHGNPAAICFRSIGRQTN